MCEPLLCYLRNFCLTISALSALAFLAFYLIQHGSAICFVVDVACPLVVVVVLNQVAYRRVKNWVYSLNKVT